MPRNRVRDLSGFGRTGMVWGPENSSTASLSLGVHFPATIRVSVYSPLAVLLTSMFVYYYFLV